MASTSEVLRQIRSHESRGYSNPYGLTPEQNSGYPKSHASGAYQYQPGTWRSFTQASGIGTEYDEAYKAPPHVQDAVTAWAISTPEGKALGGSSHWSKYSGGLSPVTVNDVDPYALAAGDGSGTGNGSSDGGISFDADGRSSGGTSEGGDYGGGGTATLPEGFQIDPYAGGEGVDPWTPGGYSSGGKPVPDSATPGGAAPSGGGLPGILAYGWDKLLRVALILLGVVLVAVAAWGMVRGEFDPVAMATQAARKGAKSV